MRTSHLFLVAPQDRGPRLDLSLGEHEVEVHDLILAMVAHQHHQATLPQLDAVLDELPHARVHFLAHHFEAFRNPSFFRR